MKRNLIILSLSLLTTGCGGGSSSSDSEEESNAEPVQAVVEQQSTTSERLEAEPDFDFSVERDIELLFSTDEMQLGALHIYSATDESAPLDILAFDPRSRVTSIRVDLVPKVNITVNSNWDRLIMHWVPMSSAAERTFELILERDRNRYEVPL